MQAHFLLGPAGSGKTFHCLAEIRTELKRSPEGLPLLLLAPKQATAQLERQLLADPSLPGYTRLQILSFERLAEFILEESTLLPPRLLDEEGRVMALRALLARHRAQLEIFRSTARLPNFAQELSLLLREFQRHQISSERLETLAGKFAGEPTLGAKLRDLSRLTRAYHQWLEMQHLQDADNLLDLATQELRCRAAEPSPERKFRFAGLWLDGFAEMTPQEIDLLLALLPSCDRATLAFCLENEPAVELSWLSQWSGIGRTYQICRQRITALTGDKSPPKIPARTTESGRFAQNKPLRELEAGWTKPAANPPAEDDDTCIGLIRCADPEAEAVLAAREILRFVRTPRADGGRNRFRDCAIILRSLQSYEAILTRVFHRYEIPCFLDRREPVAHHPLAELTRYAIRLLAYDWRGADWFGLLKTGLLPATDAEIDFLENEALARGWEGRKIWLHPLAIAAEHAHSNQLEQLRRQIVPPLERLDAMLGSHTPDGETLSGALRAFWQALEVEATLTDWSEANSDPTCLQINQATAHRTVYEQMERWLENIRLAFTGEQLPLTEWLPILESGLANLTVGVIPPALDQVLIGAIDRSRQPELKFALVLGLNEGVFPASVTAGPLLTEAERDALAVEHVQLSADRRQRVGRERFYGYIAVTRASERLLLTTAKQDTDGQPLNASPFFTQAQQITARSVEEFEPAGRWWDAEHVNELATNCLRSSDSPEVAPLLELPALKPLLAKHRQLQEAAGNQKLSADTVERLFGRELKTSVSALEQFAACPFKFFAARALRLNERREFTIDSRDRGSLQHEVLREFHRRVTKSGGRWRDLDAEAAGGLIAQIGNELLPAFEGGKFLADSAARFTATFLLGRLQQLIKTLIEWMPQYGFDPVAVEVAFDDNQGELPSWRLKIDAAHTLLLRGRIDRVDLCRQSDHTALAVVMDYKSSVRKLDAIKLHHGLDLQLLSYLGVLKNLPDPQAFFGVRKLQAAGVFFIPLNGGGRTATDRPAAVADDPVAQRAAYQHHGRFLSSELASFDRRTEKAGDQFKYSRNKEGELNKRGNEALAPAEFNALCETVETHLRSHGTRIFAGEIGVSPFRTGRESACDYCDFRPVCRFDPWTQPYRQLRPPPKPEDGASTNKRKGAKR